ncbi:Ig-like domain-containing protein [Archangium gephyra]|uniref:Ig-like domain-containing protein n=1 Tax=Archangium gephyra TaxID=48 RepID=UPI0035D47E43
MKSIFNPLMAASVLLLASACAKVERIEVKPAKVALSEAGESVALSAQAVTAEGKPVEKAELAFASTNTKVATVDATGKVTAVKSGSANISVTSGEVSASAPVEVIIPSAILIKGAPFTLTGLDTDVAVEAEVQDDAGRPVKESKMEFAAADASVVQVEGNRLVAKGVGTAKVTATAGKLTQEFEVTVKLPEVDAVAFETVPATLKVGESAPLAVVAKGANGAAIKGVSFTFTTSDEKIATVDAAGHVKAVKAGAVTIKAEGGSKATEAKLTIKKK